VYQIYEIIYNYIIERNKEKEKDIILSNEEIYSIRLQIINKNNIFFKDQKMKTVYTKKLLYFIQRIYSIFIKIFKKSNESFKKNYILLLKNILLRGSNYFKHYQIHLLNNIIKNENKHEQFFHYLMN
jgi:hypothetical protein